MDYELIYHIIKTAEEISETAHNILSEPKDFKRLSSMANLATPLKIHDVFFKVLAHIYRLADEAGEEDVKRRAKEVLLKMVKNIHAPIAILGAIEEGEKLRSIEGEVAIPNGNISYIPYVILDPSEGLVTVLYFDENEDLIISEPIPLGEDPKNKEILRNLIVSTVIPMGAVVGRRRVAEGSRISLYESVKRLMGKSYDKISEIIGEPILRRYKKDGKGYIIPIGMSHVLPREAFVQEYYEEELGEFVPISRPVLFKPKKFRGVGNLSVLLHGTRRRWIREFEIKSLIKLIKEELKRLGRREVDLSGLNPEEVAIALKKYLNEGKNIILISHVSSDLRADYKYKIVVPNEKTERGYVEIFIDEIMRATQVYERGLAIIFGCLGAAAVPLSGTMGIESVDRSVSVSLTLAAKGYKYTVGTVRESIDKYFDEFYSEFLRRVVLEEEDPVVALSRVKYERYEEGERFMRPLPVIYEIPV